MNRALLTLTPPFKLFTKLLLHGILSRGKDVKGVKQTVLSVCVCVEYITKRIVWGLTELGSDGYLFSFVLT